MLKVHDQAASMVGCQNLVRDMLLAHTQLAALSLTLHWVGWVKKERDRERQGGKERDPFLF